MPNNRPVRKPPPDFGGRKLQVRRLRNSVFLRLHRKSANAIGFSLSPDHRFSPPTLPFPVLYAGKDFETCCMEVFGDTMMDHGMAISLSNWSSTTCSRLKITANVCDLTEKKTRLSCGIDLPSLMYPDLSIPKRWASAIASHPAQFEGILYPSRFTGNTCIALFGRRTPQRIQSTPAFPLSKETKETAKFLNKYGIRLV